MTLFVHPTRTVSHPPVFSLRKPIHTCQICLEGRLNQLEKTFLEGGKKDLIRKDLQAVIQKINPLLIGPRKLIMGKLKERATGLLGRVNAVTVIKAKVITLDLGKIPPLPAIVKEIDQYLSKVVCPKEIQAMFTTLKGSQVSAEWLLGALKSHAKEFSTPLTVEIVPNNQISFLGHWDWSHNKIRIKQDNPNKFATLLFEMMNVMRTTKFREINDLVKSKKIKTAEEYAKAEEAVEYESVNSHVEFVQKWQGPTSPLHLYYGSWKNFDEYWNTQLKSGHAKYYLDWFTENA